MSDLENDKLEVEELSLKFKTLKEEIKDESKDKKLLKEIVCIVTIIIGILILINVYSSDNGIIGKFLYKSLLYLFGSGAYLFPIAILIVGTYVGISEGDLDWKIFIYALIIFTCVISIMYIFKAKIDPEITYSIREEIKQHTYGGIIGSGLGSILITFIGKMSSIIFISMIIVIVIRLIIKQSLIEIIAFLILFFNSKIKREFNKFFVPEDSSEEKFLEENEIDFSKEENFDDLDYLEATEGNVFKNNLIRKENKPKENKFINYVVGDIFEDTGVIERETLESLSQIEEIEPVKKIKNKLEDKYKFPSIDYLNKNFNISFSKKAHEEAKIREEKLKNTLKQFGVDVEMKGYKIGPTVTRYELTPKAGVKVSRISGLADDIALNMAAQGIRIEAPIPGKPAVGIEIPNEEARPVFLREVIDTEEFRKFKSNLAFALGKDIEGNVIIGDIGKMPHLLIAGATGSGKSVCINTLIISILYKSKPEDVKLLMIDPKVVELNVYNGIPHLISPVVTDPKKAASALKWAVDEMLNRYNLFSKTGVRDLKGYNLKQKEKNKKILPEIVIIIDELADLMMASPSEVEDSICRLAQMARAAGMHLIIATQRPSVDIITGVIKANIPSRLAFSVSSGIDSRTILDMVGAEKLLGKGDMLFYPMGENKPIRIQGAYISDKEVENIVDFMKNTQKVNYNDEMIESIEIDKINTELSKDIDELFEDAIEIAINEGKASASFLQRKLKVGYNRAARIIEAMEEMEIVGPEDGSRPRKVLVTKNEWEEIKKNL